MRMLPCASRFSSRLRLVALNVDNDAVIEWSKLPDADWYWWSGNNLRQRWQTMRDRVYQKLGNPHASFQEVLGYLKEKMDQVPKAKYERIMAKHPKNSTGDSSDDDEGDSGRVDADVANALTGCKKLVKKSGPTKSYRTKEFVSSSDDGGATDSDETEDEMLDPAMRSAQAAAAEAAAAAAYAAATAAGVAGQGHAFVRNDVPVQTTIAGNGDDDDSSSDDQSD